MFLDKIDDTSGSTSDGSNLKFVGNKIASFAITCERDVSILDAFYKKKKSEHFSRILIKTLISADAFVYAPQLCQ